MTSGSVAEPIGQQRMRNIDDRLPVSFRCLGERDEVCGHEHARHAFNFGNCVCGGVVGRFSRHDGRGTANRYPDAELQGIGVGCPLDLYRHGVSVDLVCAGVVTVLEMIDAVGIRQW